MSPKFSVTQWVVADQFYSCISLVALVVFSCQSKRLQPPWSICIALSAAVSSCVTYMSTCSSVPRARRPTGWSYVLILVINMSLSRLIYALSIFQLLTSHVLLTETWWLTHNCYASRYPASCDFNDNQPVLWHSSLLFVLVYVLYDPTYVLICCGDYKSRHLIA